MNHFTILYQIAVDRHNDRLRKADRMRLINAVGGRYSFKHVLAGWLDRPGTLILLTIRKAIVILKKGVIVYR